MIRTVSAFFFAAIALAATTSYAQFDLQITEIWPGNEPGENLTSDWFEVTNLGDAAYTSADGDLYFDDESQDPADGALLMGVSSIAPGESVVFVDDDDTTEFASVWSNVILPQLGTYDGSGLGQGGDGVTLFLDADMDGVEQLDIIDFETYPDADLNGGQSYDVLLGEFSVVGNANGALASSISNDVDQFAIGSIGAEIPEPATVALAAVAACGLLAARRV